MSDLANGGLGGLGDFAETPIIQGCGCVFCRAPSKDGDGADIKGRPEDIRDLDVLPHDGTTLPDSILDDGALGASGPGRSTLLPLTPSGTPRPFFNITGDRNIDGVLIGSKWNLSEITYSFPTTGAAYGAGYDTGKNEFHIDLGPLQQSAALASFAMIGAFTNLTFRNVTGTAELATLRLSQTGDTDVGSAQGLFPADRSDAGDIWFGRTSQPYYDLQIKGTWGFATMMHEIGHTMGLKHGMDDYSNSDLSSFFGTSPRRGTRPLESDFNSQSYSLMTYNPSAGTPGVFGGDKENQPQSFMQSDIAALQYMYGANFTTNAGASVYTWNAVTGEMFINGVSQGDAFGSKILMTVWDGGGVDTFDLSNYNGGVEVDLRAGEFSTFSVAQLANHTEAAGTVNLAVGNVATAKLYQGDLRSLIENATGGDGNDILTGNQVNNVLTGGLGNDRLEGGAGSDTLDGGGGSDTAVLGGSIGLTVALDAAGNATVVNGADTDTLVGIENVVGSSGSDTLTGNAQNNLLDGGRAGVDVLDGAGGNDILIGNRGTFGFSSKADVAKLAAQTINSIATAYNTAGTFDLDDNPNIELSTILAHTTINAVSTAGLEYYRVDVAAGDRAIFDMDNAAGQLSDSFIELVDATGRPIASNDFDYYDTGSPSNDDSRITFTFDTAGTYYIRIGRWNGNNNVAQPLLAGTAYTLHISLTPGVPGTIHSALGDILVDGGSATLTGGAGDDLLVASHGADTLSGGTEIDTASYANAFAGVTVSLGLQGAAQNTVNAGSDTLTSIENLIGSNFNDTLTGDAGDNGIEGGRGDDTLNGVSGVDTASYFFSAAGVTVSLGLQGAAQNTVGAGSDTLSNFDNLIGSAFNDVLTGDGAANTLAGGVGDDVLNGFSTGVAGLADSLIGGDGSDTASFAGYAGGVTATIGGNAVDTVGGFVLATFSSIENLTGGLGNDILTGDTGVNTLTGGDGGDTLDGGGGDDRLEGGIGDDTITGGAGTGDTVVFTGATGVTINLATLTAQATGFGNDTITGVENVATGSGTDNVTGDGGNNIFYEGGGADSYAGGGGVDTVDYSGATSTVTYNLTTGGAQNTGAYGGTDTLVGISNLVGGAFNDVLTGNADANRLVGGGGLDTLSGADGSDTLQGGDNHDALSGDINATTATTGGDDVLEGGAGNDVLTGGFGKDQLVGGSGDDILVNGVAQVGTGLINGVPGAGFFAQPVNTVDGGDDSFDGGAGSDTAYAYYTGRAGGVVFDLGNIEGNSAVTIGGVAAGSFTSVERVLFRGGEGADMVKGGGTLDSLVGNGGNDILDGWFGNDLLQGMAGNDTLIGGDGLDTATYVGATAGVSVDLRITTQQDTVGDGLDTLTGIEYLIGSAFSDTLQGDDDFNLITDGGFTTVTPGTGGGGNDSLFGHGGNDEIILSRLAAASAGTILLDGGAGNDIIIYNSGTLSVAPAASPDVISGTVIPALNVRGARFVDTITVAGGDGNDRIQLTAVATATVDAGTGADVVAINMEGGAGVSAHTITLGAGADILQLNSNSAAGASVRNNVLTDFQVGDAGDRFELRGTTLAASSYLNANTFTGYTLGADPFATGYMRLLQSGTAMLLQVDQNGGGDSFVTVFTLNNTYTGGFTAFNFDGFDAVLNVTGFAGAETITGGAKADALNGGDGDDVLRGLAGADVLDGGVGSDTADYSEKTTAVDVFLNGANYVSVSVNGVAEDTIRNIENVTGGSAADTLVGDALNNVLSGGGGDDILGGNGGEDTLHGGDGQDILVGSTENDSLFGDVGDDELYAGDGNDIANGGLNNDFIRGMAGNDQLFGGGGLDTMYGEEGDDAITGGDGDDFAFGGIGVDTIISGLGNDLLVGEDGDDILNGEDGDDQAYGGAGSDTMDGGAGNDFLRGLGDADTIRGGDGFDTLIGDGGGDLLSGGEGADSFLFLAVGDSLIGASDVILDFATGIDKLDFRPITNGGPASFALLQAGGGYTAVDIDIGNDGTVDMRLVLAPGTTVAAGDFLF